MYVETKEKRMNKGMIAVLGVFGIIVIGSFMVAGTFISYFNRDTNLRVLMEAKQTDNQSEFDNVKKKILQVAKVTDKQMESLKEIFVSYADARTSQDSEKMMNWVQEAIPNVDTKTFDNLQNIIVSSRDAFTMRQKELIDLKREHDALIKMFPGNIILGMIMGKKPFEIQIVTSTRTKESFKTGVDDDTDLFESKSKPVLEK